MSTQAIADGPLTDTPRDTELAPYALVRLAALPYPATPDATAAFRTAYARLVEVTRALGGTAAALGDALYASADGHDAEFHRKVVLPLRRDVHNGRLPRPVLLDQLGDLPERVPQLRVWLDAMAEVTALRGTVAQTAPEALSAERAALAATCSADPLRRAVTLTGADLLRGIDRAAACGSTPDARARKGEHNALRYALRVDSKTSPLSWFTYVAWGQWAAADETENVHGEPVAVARANRTLLAKVVTAVQGNLRDSIAYRLAPSIRVDGGTVNFRRDTPLGYGDRIVAAREEEVGLAYSAPLALIVAQARSAGPAGVTPAYLAEVLAGKLPGEPEQVAAKALRFVLQVIDGGLLAPIAPANPQDIDALTTTAGWLDRHGEAALANLLRRIETATNSFVDRATDGRMAALAGLKELWQEAFAEAGADWIDAPVLSEDVGIRTPLRLGNAHGRDAVQGLARLATLVELFDQYLVFRRLARDRFVAGYGVGGATRDLAGFAVQMGEIWKAGGLLSLSGEVNAAPGQESLLTPELRELAEARRLVVEAVAASRQESDAELWLTDDITALAEAAMPAWVRSRPASYSFFVQPYSDGSLDGESNGVVLNHIYAGWGRFTSRFLDLVAPEARAQVAAQVRRGVGPGSRIAQFRPVNGFNANLHPLLVGDEVGEDPAWASIAGEDIEVVHDTETDQVRLRVDGTYLDVLYLGFLVPFILPDRMVPLYLDFSAGLASINHLAPASKRPDGTVVWPRLRYRDIVLTRRAWRVPAEDVGALQQELATAGDVPAEAVAGWQARHGLPPEVFLGPIGTDMKSADDLAKYVNAHKPQFVDFGNALHLRTLSRLLGRHDGGVRIEEALPVPGRGNPDGRVVELVTEVYRARSQAAHDEGRAR
ncbi:lantibiotic dehydratase [Hamadaea tsunoensis]|uniref:lantibiotic dehydratase n=1 Tax=Hamadaea tsunoensis TaxID=53368 RepID=UPI00040EFE7F|nr:lantibiotic dehydratase [Hamadaea tsunoensis]